MGSIHRASGQADANAEHLESQVRACDRAFGEVTVWNGATRVAAFNKSADEATHAREVRNLLFRLADEAGDAARELDAVRNYVLGKALQAELDGCVVSDTGKVTAAANSTPSAKERAAALQSALQSGLTQVDLADQKFAAILRAVATDLQSIKEGQPDVSTPAGKRDPNDVVKALVHMSANERATYLARMSPADVRQLVLADPKIMGQLDGVPFQTRIAANEMNIREALVTERKKPNPDKTLISKYEGMLQPRDHPYKKGADGQPAKVDRKFVKFAPPGQPMLDKRPNTNGRLIELVGDIDADAKGVGVHVPGTSTKQFGHDAGEHALAERLAKMSHSAVLMYEDGDFPPHLAAAPQKSYAANMAPLLVEFGHEVNREVANNAPGKQVTYLGQSYGGSIVGTAEQLGLRADRVVHLSSAGTGIYDVDYRSANPHAQRYSMTAPGDFIGSAQSAPREINPHGGHPQATDPDLLPGVTRLDSGYDRHGKLIEGGPGHTDYLRDEQSTALKNAAAVIAGDPVTLFVDRGLQTPGMKLPDGGKLPTLSLDDLPVPPDPRKWLPSVKMPRFPDTIPFGN